MASAFDRLTESDELRAWESTRPLAESLAKSNESIFDAELKSLNLQEKRGEMARRDEDLALSQAFGREVVAKSKTPEELAANRNAFIAQRPDQGNKILEMSSKASSFLSGDADAELKLLQLQSAKRSEKMKVELFASQ